MKNINKFFLASLFCALCMSTVFGQVEVQETSNINVIELERSIIAQKSDLTIIKGNENVIAVSQQGINEINSVIQGDRNQLNLLQIGERNLYVTTQYGKRNQLTSSVKGKYNEINITQNGFGNVIDQSIVNSEANKFVIIQNGANHNLIHKINDENGKALDIKMTGNGMKIVIESNN